MDYWKITTNDGQRFEIPATYYGDQCVLDLAKKNGVIEMRLISVQPSLAEQING